MITRRIENKVRNTLKRSPAVALLGPRQVGKTTITLNISDTVPSVYLDLEDKTDLELNLYIDYLQTDVQSHFQELNDKKKKQFEKFKTQLQSGINYYKQVFNELPDQASLFIQDIYKDLNISEGRLNCICI